MYTEPAVHTIVATIPCGCNVSFFAAQFELPLVPAHVLSVTSNTWVLNQFSCKRQQPTRALANQNATSHLRQSGRLSVRHAMAAKGKFLPSGLNIHYLCRGLFSLKKLNVIEDIDVFLGFTRTRGKIPPSTAVEFDVQVQIYRKELTNNSTCPLKTL